MIAYKLMRIRKDGSLGSLFINKKDVLPLNKWLNAKPYLTKGFAFRPGWHCTFKPYAPHLSEKGRVWVKVEIKDFVTYPRPESQGGEWILANKIKLLEILKEKSVLKMQ